MILTADTLTYFRNDLLSHPHTLVTPVSLPQFPYAASTLNPSLHLADGLLSLNFGMTVSRAACTVKKVQRFSTYIDRG